MKVTQEDFWDSGDSLDSVVSSRSDLAQSSPVSKTKQKQSCEKWHDIKNLCVCRGVEGIN